MNYLNAWRILHGIVFSIYSSDEVDDFKLEQRFSALNDRSLIWLSTTNNAEAAEIRDQIEARLAELSTPEADADDSAFFDDFRCAA